MAKVRLGEAVTPSSGELTELWIRAHISFGFVCTECRDMVSGQIMTSNIEAEVPCPGCGTHYIVSASPSANRLIEYINADLSRA